jgi:hypothetical protein
MLPDTVRILIAPGAPVAALVEVSGTDATRRKIALMIPESREQWLPVNRKVLGLSQRECLLEGAQWRVRVRSDGSAELRDDWSSMYAAIVRAEVPPEDDDRRPSHPLARPTRELLLHSNANAPEAKKIVLLRHGDCIIHEYATWKYVRPPV